MDMRFNTIAGWTLAGAAAALALSIASGMAFHSPEVEKKGYPIEGVEEGGGGEEAAVPLPVLLASADAAAGEKIFAGKCAACHTIASGGANGVGPNLYGVVGKKHGHLPGFAYSSALTSVPGPWDFPALDAWLKSPRKYASGTKMTFAGLPDAQDRANVIVYLNSQGSNLPLPAAPAADAPTEAEANVDAGANTADVANTAVSENAPSQDPAAAVNAEEKGSLPKAD